MASLWLVLCFAGMIAVFWYRRKIAEAASVHAHRQAQQLQVQFVSVECKKWRIGILSNGQLGIKSEFMFEFSSDGERLYQGELLLENEKLKRANIPPYAV